jgi:subfamily B ATP-binding cassette protein HlyB/CyaB
MRLAQLWTDFQQTGISVQRLGDILNTRTELANRRGRAARARSRCRRWPAASNSTRWCSATAPTRPEVLRGIDLAISPAK